MTGIRGAIFGYGSAFVFAAVFLTTAILVVIRAVPGGPAEKAPHSEFDYPGTGLPATGLTALLLTIGEGSNWVGVVVDRRAVNSAGVVLAV